MNEIKIEENVSIFVKNLDLGIELKDLVGDLMLNVVLNQKTKGSLNPNVPQDKRTPGVQSDVLIKSKNISLVTNTSVEEIKKIAGLDNKYPYYEHNWVYISTSGNKMQGWHKHEFNKKNDINRRKIDWTYVFYAQIPNNLEGDDGYILFRGSDGKITKILPNPGDLVIFPSTLDHMPNINPKSTIDRVVLCGNFISLHDEIMEQKNTKTLI
jgi:hypothetical protein